MASLGERLRKTRENQARPLAQAAADTRICERYLAAIEADNLQSLPGSFFTRSFVRQYAGYLGVPSSEIDPELDRVLATSSPPLIPGQEPRRHGPDVPPLTSYIEGPQSPNRKLVAAFTAFVAVVILCAVLYSYWLESPDPAPLEAISNPLPAPVPPPAVNLPQEAGPKEPPAGQPDASNPTASVQPLPAAESTQPPPTAKSTQPSPVADDTQMNGKSALSTLNAGDGPLTFEIQAKERVWVRVASQGRRLWTRTMEPREVKGFTGLEQALVLVGNAGGIDIVSNGRPAGRIGPRGQVRVITVTPEGVHVAEPRKKQPRDDS